MSVVGWGFVVAGAVVPARLAVVPVVLRLSKNGV